MENHPVIQELQHGCMCLNLPTSVAVELIRYLITKRLSCEETGSSLGCSSKLDELQHWILLETDVREEVEALIGGKIWHTQTTMGNDCAQKVQSR